MIAITNIDIWGWEAAVRGMRNPLNSWDKSDTEFSSDSSNDISLGEKDLVLMLRLSKSGESHAKYRRMIQVSMDILAPLYWWKEFDTYKVGTVANSCSTMHTLHTRDLTLDDFSCEHLRVAARNVLKVTIEAINAERQAYMGEGLPAAKGDKQCWYSMIQLLPSSYNQLRTVSTNYEVLSRILADRSNHKLDEWQVFCEWIRTLPHAETLVRPKGN